MPQKTILKYVLFGLILISLLLNGSYRLLIQHITQSIHDDLIHQAQEISTHLNHRLETSIKHIHTDLYFLSDLIEDNYRFHEAELEFLKPHFLAVSKHTKHYDQIAFLDHSGVEKIRIDYNNGMPSAAYDRELRSKAKHFYFTEAVSFNKHEIYTAPFELNTENRKIEIPLKPAIRFAKPVVNRHGITLGVVTINYLGQHLLDDIRHSGKRFNGNINLVNQEGYFLISPDNTLNWDFMFPQRTQIRFQDSYPNIWQNIPQFGFGHRKTNKGVFAYSQLYTDISNATDKHCFQCKLTLVLHTPSEHFERMVKSRLFEWRGYLVTIVGIFLALVIYGLRTHLKQRESIRQLKLLHQQITDERDLFVVGPTIVIKWDSQFGWPVNYISSNVEQLLGHQKQRFDSGELSFSSIIAPEFLHQIAIETQRAQRENLSWFEHSPYQVVRADGKRLWVRDTTTVIHNKDSQVTQFFAYINDITPLEEAKEELENSHQYIQKVVDTIADPTLVIDIANYKLLIANQSARDIYAGGKEIPADMTCHLLSHKCNTPCTGKHDPCPIQAIRDTGQATRVIHKHFSNDGATIYAEVNATPIYDKSGKNIVQIIESHRDITQHVEMEQQLKQLAATDRLTQISNRLEFDKQLEEQVQLAHANGTPLGLIMFDLDHFKRVNDTYGHDVGDEVIQETVNRIKTHTRKTDLLARWGGEEFMMIAPLITRESAEHIAEELRQRVCNVAFDKVGMVTISLGVAMLKPNEDIASLVKRVDEALYQSKQNGRNRTTVAD